VINLLQNALKYSADVVHCRLIYEKQKVTLEIQDSGPGIPENDQPHIFEMFYRGSNTTAVRGTGVGLSVVKRATEAHGGAVSFTTGQSGSMFRVKLPRHYMLEPEV
jgi:signal transduction histidine kinase